MTVQLQNGRAVPQDEVLAFESAVGHTMPPDYRAFVRSQDGARPVLNVFRIADDNASGVNRFIPLSQIREEKASIALPTGCWPIAWAEGGNYVCIDCATGGTVYFWDHESPRELVRLADSFTEFMALLQPFDAREADLGSYHVENAWIAPGFRDGG